MKVIIKRWMTFLNFWRAKYMQLSEFHQQYANLSLEKRGVMLSFERFATMTMADLYKRINMHQEFIAPHKIEIQTLLAIAEEFLPKLREKS